VFGATNASSFYWSASTDFIFPTLAWFVDFQGGHTGSNSMFLTYRVRAVRGGS
jgi:hypothetical protein